VAITNGAFGGDLAQEAKRRASVRIKLFHGSTLDCLDELIEKEQQLNIPLSSLNVVINDYRDLLLPVIRLSVQSDNYQVAGFSAAVMV